MLTMLMIWAVCSMWASSAKVLVARMINSIIPVLTTKVLANKCLRTYFEASRSSIDLLESSRQLRKQLSIHCCCECSVQPNPCSQKLATEYAKLRAQSAVLKKGLLEEQERSQSLQDQVFILKKKNIFKYLLRLTKERHHYEKEKERWKPCCSGLTFHRMQS